MQKFDLIIIGGGAGAFAAAIRANELEAKTALGLEFAQMFARFGAKVTVLQRGPSILPQIEKALTDRLTEVLEKEVVTIITKSESIKIAALSFTKDISKLSCCI